MNIFYQDSTEFEYHYLQLLFMNSIIVYTKEKVGLCRFVLQAIS